MYTCCFYNSQELVVSHIRFLWKINKTCHTSFILFIHILREQFQKLWLHSFHLHLSLSISVLDFFKWFTVDCASDTIQMKCIFPDVFNSYIYNHHQKLEIHCRVSSQKPFTISTQIQFYRPRGSNDVRQRFSEESHKPNRAKTTPILIHFRCQ